MKVVDVQHHKLILEDARGYRYMLLDTTPEQLKYPPIGKFILAVNHRNKPKLRMAKHTICDKTLLEWAEVYLLDDTVCEDEAYYAFLPIYFRYDAFKKWLKNNVNESIYKNADKKQLLTLIAKFIIERYGKDKL